MNGQHSYLLVEGPQDVYFVGRLLMELGLQSAQHSDEVPARWQPFIDSSLQQLDQARRASGRESVPFWQMFKPACVFNDSHVIVVEKVDGNRAQFGRRLRATDALIDGGLGGLTGVGIIPDADTNPMAALASAQEALRSAGLAVPDMDQQIVGDHPRTGIFVLPGNGHAGGLEEILLDCATSVYPSLAAGAIAYVDAVDIQSAEYTAEDTHEIRTPQGPAKAKIGAISTVLKPGSTIQTSILRDRWVCPATMAVPRVNSLVAFLRRLCGLA